MNHIFRNSYIILIIAFIVLCIIFYLFQIGYTTAIDSNGNVVKKFSWKYPLAISLILWVVWHFYLYPPEDELTVDKPTYYAQTVDYSQAVENVPARQIVPATNEIGVQKISLINWN